MIISKLQSAMDEHGNRVLAAQNVPFGEKEHNEIVPQECWCSPDMWSYFEETGEVHLVIADHHYVQ